MSSTSYDRRTRLRRPALLAWLRLARVYSKIDRVAMEHLRRHDLSVAQFDALAQIGITEGMTQQELADHLLVTKGNISQLIARLEERGLIRRCPEGRTQRLYLTDEGREAWTCVVPLNEETIIAQFDALVPAEQRQLLNLLSKLDHALE